MVEKAPNFFFEFFGSRSFYFLHLSHLKPILIKMAHSLPNFHQFLSHFIPPKFFIYFQSLFTAFFYLFFFFGQIPKSRGQKERSKQSECDQNFFSSFLGPICYNCFIKVTGNLPQTKWHKVFQHLTKNSLLQGGFASQAFSKKKKGIFQDQILNVHIFFSFSGVTILTGYLGLD